MVLLNLLNGVSLGSVLFLLASSLSLILGVMGILNLAQGALYMIGAYVTWLMAVKLGLNFGLAVLGAGITAGLVGLLMERGFLRHLYKQVNEQALLTFGFVYIITNIGLWIFGGQSIGTFVPDFLSGSFSVGALLYPWARVFLILTGLVVFAGLWWLQNKTRIGAIIRAGMDDKETTSGLGINLGRINYLVFSLGAFLAGVAGAIGGQLLGVNLQLSINVLLLALVVVVIGGMGSVEGALLGGMLIGVVDAFGKALFPELAMFTIYLAMIITLLVKPSGLLGRKI
jgi:branched-chain amino acid transport system permease protein